MSLAACDSPRPAQSATLVAIAAASSTYAGVCGRALGACVPNREIHWFAEEQEALRALPGNSLTGGVLVGGAAAILDALLPPGSDQGCEVRRGSIAIASALLGPLLGAWVATPTERRNRYAEPLGLSFLFPLVGSLVPVVAGVGVMGGILWGQAMLD